MKAACPQCGADVEFRFDDSFVRVCDSCRSAVVRTDRGLETLGKFADLVETASPLALFAAGSWQGKSFQLVGRAQVKHPAGGSWDEWYARFDDGRWGWLSEAQGRFYLLFEVAQATGVPPIAELSTGAKLDVPGAKVPMTIAEVAAGTYAAAAGELPFVLVPGSTYAYADLSGPGGAFATIDYDPRAATPSVYVGEQVPLADLHVAGGVTAAPAAPSIRARRLACPNCDGSLELRAPDATMRVGCPFCGALLDVGGGALSVLSKLDHKTGAQLDLPLGSKGTFEGTTLTVIGWMQRNAVIDGDSYPFEEYLLYEPSLGFRWLVLSDGQWSYAQPVDVGEVADEGTQARYGGVAFRRFQIAPLVVKRVVGEMYWKVAEDETVTGFDFVAPPAMLSKEDTGTEVNWSLSTWMSHQALERAFDGVPIPAAGSIVAPNAPPLLRGIGTILAILIAALVGAGIVVSGAASDKSLRTVTCDQGSTPPPSTDPAYTPPANSAVCFSEPFPLEGGKNIEIVLRGNANNSWISVGGDLVDEATGDVESFDRDIEYYAGVEDGESWSEGGQEETVYLDPMPEGRYVLRVELQSSALAYQVTAEVHQGVFHGRVFWEIAGIVVVPGLVLLLIWWVRERRRWKDSDYAPGLMGKLGTDDD